MGNGGWRLPCPHGKAADGAFLAIETVVHTHTLSLFLAIETFCECSMFTGKKKNRLTLRKCQAVLVVIRLGLEPKTPTLKVLCSTN